MGMKQNIKKFMNNPGMLTFFLGRKGFLKWMDDKRYIGLQFKVHLGYRLDWNHPTTYNEKLQWMKLYYRKPEFTRLVDKIEVKKIVSETIGAEYLIPTLWTGENFDDIDFSVLPKQFVIKCTHDSGSTVICKDKATFNVDEAKKFVEKHLKTNLYWAGREWAYKDVPPRIIIEKYIGTDREYPEDYKFYVFNGRIDCVMVCRGREKGYPQFYFYDKDWNRLQYLKEEPIDDAAMPQNYKEMLEIVARLAKDFPAVRIDLYNVGGQIYFGEYTFYSQNGFDVDLTRETDEYWGSLIDLSELKGE